MKQTILPFLALIGLSATAQTTLPTGWNFDDPTPLGWTESLDQVVGTTRYTTGQVGASCKLDGDDEYVMVYFADVAGPVTYYIKGQGTALTNDIFTIQESVNGTSWTTMRELIGAQIDNNTHILYTDQPQGASRYVRWYFTEKQSGRNISLDEISVSAQTVTNAQEIRVSSGGNTMINGSTFVVGNAASTAMTIDNVNLAAGTALNVTAMNISGPNAADFSISGVSAPFNVAAAGSQAFSLNFSAGGTGSRSATLTISNNDANGDETSYVINLYGIGGQFATEPSAQPTAINFSGTTSYTYNVSFSAPAQQAERYIVLRKKGSAVTETPVDGTSYTKGDYIGGAQVVHNGSAGTFTPSGVVAGTTYHFSAFAVNGPAGYENYLTTAPATGSVTTSATMMGSYYNGIDATQTNFPSTLQSRINQSYNQIFYSNYSTVMINGFEARDTTDGQRVVDCAYSNFHYVWTGQFFHDVISREHRYPHSWMDNYPDQDVFNYSDLHNLVPAHQDGVNAVRSNLPYGNVVQVTSTFEEGTYGKDANGRNVYEPRDGHKGDAARALFYMAVKWNGTQGQNGNGNWGFPNPIDFITSYGQDQEVLREWHWQDLPDAYEIARNDYVESVQGNRNPFVDSVDWVCYFDFDDVSYVANPNGACQVGIEEMTTLSGLSAYPNPTSGQVAVELQSTVAQRLNYTLSDATGRTVFSEGWNVPMGGAKRYFDLSHLPKGFYLMRVSGEGSDATLRITLAD
jgi:endonuclease I